MADADLWVARLNAEDAAAIWPAAAPLLAPALDRGAGLYALEDVGDLVTRPGAGTEFGWSLWIIGRKAELLGAWTTEVRVFPRARILAIIFAGGRQMRRWYGFALAETEKFARESGCAKLLCEGRKGWARMGYQPLGFWYERAL